MNDELWIAPFAVLISSGVYANIWLAFKLSGKPRDEKLPAGNLAYRRRVMRRLWFVVSHDERFERYRWVFNFRRLMVRTFSVYIWLREMRRMRRWTSDFPVPPDARAGAIAV